MKIDLLEIGNVRFHKSVSSLADVQLQDFLNKLDKFGSTNSIENEKFGNHSIAVLDFTDDNVSVERAVLNVERALNVLRFYLSGIANHPVYYKMSMGIEGKVFTGTTGAIVIGDKHRYFQSNREGATYSYIVEDSSITAMNNAHLQLVNTILRKDEQKKTDFERNLLTAIDYYGMGIGEFQYGNALVHFMISLESLLLEKRESKGALLAERSSILLGTNLEQREGVFKRVKRLYELRSDYVHEGKNNLNEDDIYNAATLVRSVIMKLIPISDKIANKSTLKQKFESLKLNCPVFNMS